MNEIVALMIICPLMVMVGLGMGFALLCAGSGRITRTVRKSCLLVQVVRVGLGICQIRRLAPRSKSLATF